MLEFHRLLFLMKHLRSRGRVLNVIRLVKAREAALVAVLLAVPVPGTGSKNQVRNLNFLRGNLLRRNGIMRFFVGELVFLAHGQR